MLFKGCLVVMVVRSFSLNEEVFKNFHEMCSQRGLNMSKQIEFFMQYCTQTNPALKQETLNKIHQTKTETNPTEPKHDTHRGIN